MSESFGARLRRRREEQSIALGTIAEQTKIKQSLLEALERDDVSHWPAGIFRRAFIRAYAEAIGLNPDVVVREFLEVYPDPVEVVSTSASGHDGPPTRLRHLVGSAIGSLSRRRRGPAADDPSAADSMPAHPPDPSRTGLLADVFAPPELPAPAAASPAVPPAPPEPVPDEPHIAVQAPVHASEVAAVPPCPPPPEPDLLAAAHLCTELGRVDDTTDVQPLLEEAARILDAIGLIIWLWDPQPEELRPALAHGYSARVLAQLPAVRRDADNATAAAFRSAQTCATPGGRHTSGALVVPLLTPGGCAGVLAIELQNGREQATPVRAVAIILAAQLAQLVGAAAAAAIDARPDVMVPAADPAPMRRANMRT